MQQMLEQETARRGGPQTKVNRKLPLARVLPGRVKPPLRQVREGYRLMTAPWRGLPSAIIIGAQKGGTTSLFKYLVQHPQVLAPLSKEVHYFDLHYHRGPTWYRGRFPYKYNLRRGAISLDASPYYMVHPQVPHRVAALLPHVKLIAVLRHPIERALSHYHHEVHGKRETLSFEAAIDREEERLAGEEERLMAEPQYYSYNHHRYSYLRRGLYFQQLQRWLPHFSRSQLLVLQSERLFQDPGAVMDRVHAFLGLPPYRLEGYPPLNEGNYSRGMPQALRDRLARYFEPYNRELFAWLGEEFDWS